MPSLAIIERAPSDETGAPMHAVANGWYWYADFDGKGTNLYPQRADVFDDAARARRAYLRVDPSDLPVDMTREQFEEFVETLRPQWQLEADDAIAWLRQP
jgi:hypothetical protein